MNLKHLLKDGLESTFRFQFNISDNTSPSLTSYVITLNNSEQDCFYIKVEIKDDTRLTIYAEPEKYGANFLQLMNSSDGEKRKLFVKYWETISLKNNKINVRINELPYTIESFLSDSSDWSKFNIRFTKSPFYENDSDKESIIVSYTVLICSMMLSLIDYKVEGYEEGNVIEVASKKYERNPINRELCLYAKGYTCSCCGFNFKNTYGKIGENFIEVHHIVPVSKMGPHYIVDPINDLTPLCSNCHSMIHKKNPPYTVDELKAIMEDQKNGN
ncbi:MAG: HNH endonuclease [Bacilli bacterium]|nr:HNH endonuclease [Bacilli bacterium]